MSAANSANITGSVGSLLRERRESRGVTLEEAARVTRIGKNYLAALEADTYDVLPNAAYVKGFLRAYAEFLGLSGNDVVATYERSLSPPSHPVETEKAVPELSRTSGKRGGRWFISLILLALVIAAAYILDYSKPTPQKPAPPVNAPQPTQATQATVPILPVRSSAQPSPEKAGPAEKATAVPTPTEPSPSTGGIVLKLKVNQDCWLNITIDDTVSQQYDLKAGDLIEWKGEKAFALDVGNPGGVEAEFNGRPLKKLGEVGKPVHLILKASGVSQQTQ